ncbi:succinyl-diaminopimelate desuccinylase [Candidatus Photodesmus blepharus]|uniref:Succinyl-diaminopimelate desuccinylase n=1 Tax=Candidatus Photodesmus blepharonis TaxID=1179155 RepID=A0A084CP28_9GAMM|nr:succinyl-diaminopimelate desuccinylase [Candidatus Photodesmus blepharus]KEY91557.1 succinyl-diaminopimelate desuccinylase [Candidatus Photodesmus blepharus]
MINSSILDLAKELISRKSVTPEDAGCQKLIIERLKKLGFTIEVMIFEDTTNLWARRGIETPLFAFVGHTDVVPSGSLEQWHTPPFEPTIINNNLHGRGAADMKGALACMIIAVEQFVSESPNHIGSIAFLITSNEEGTFINGTKRVVNTLMKRNEKINMCIVGEPSSLQKAGDVVKNGRRGSINGNLQIKGTEGHIAYPHLANNPIHQALPILAKFTKTKWDDGNEFFPPTSFQISNLHSGNGTSNMTPSELNVQFNFRFNTELTDEQIKHRIHSTLDAHALNYNLKWSLSGRPFLTKHGKLLEAVSKAIYKVNQKNPRLLTNGGTSDGRFIAKMGAEVLELGLTNTTIHKVNENTSVTDLKRLTDIYQKTLENLLTEKQPN